MKKNIFLLLMILGVLVTLAPAQELKSLDRVYTPIMFSGQDSTGMSGLIKSEWTAYAWDMNAKTWTAIPFQIDQVKSPGKYEHVAVDSIIHNLDEIVFMPADVGDKAPQYDWVGEEHDTSLVRLELECTDPLAPEKKGWVYLFKNVADPDTFVNYMTYHPAADPLHSAADKVSSPYYTIGHMDNGLFDFLAFPYSPDLDLLDRLKLRLAASALGQNEVIDENKIKAKAENVGPVSPYRGEVRLFRDLRAQAEIKFLGISYQFDVPANLHYYPYSISGDVGVDLSGAAAAFLSVKYIRLSMDHSIDAVGMTYYSTEASAMDGIAVDGIEDNPVFLNIADDVATPRWMMTTGEQGTFFMSIKWPEVQNGETWLYYRDTGLGDGTEDGSSDTGDDQSYSDMGMWSKTTGDGLFVSELTFAYSMYFIPENVSDHAVEFAQDLLQQHLNPVTVQVTEQHFDYPTRVTSKTAQPATFELEHAYPNPYQVGKGQQVRFDLVSNRSDNNLDLIIYNVLGQQVRRFNRINTRAGVKQSVLWDGRDMNGISVSPGLYFYKLAGSGRELTGKLLVID